MKSARVDTGDSMTFTRLLLLAVTFLSLSLVARAQSLYQAPTASPELVRQGADIYRTTCASCHDNPQGRTPPRATLTVTKSADVIIRALTTGAMRQIGATLSADGRAAVAAYLTGKPPGESGTIYIDANRCAPPTKPFTLDGPSWNGWSGRGTTNARHQVEAGLSPADVARLRLKWVFAYPGGTPGPPTVVGGRVFLPGASGLVMSLDAETGCTYWASDLGAQMRAAVSIGKLPLGSPVCVRRRHARRGPRPRRRHRPDALEHGGSGASDGPTYRFGRLP